MLRILSDEESGGLVLLALLPSPDKGDSGELDLLVLKDEADDP
jgi:hypothetical protein